MNPEPVKATFVTFYSFKGGVGRSMALINTAGILAGRRGFRVLVLDLDLEAPGLSYLDPKSPDVTPAQVQQGLPLQPGFVDLLMDAKERGEEADLFKLSGADLEAKYTRQIKIPPPLREFPDGSLRIMPAGRFDHNYAQRLDALNLNALYREGLGEPLIRAFKKKLVESGRYHYVLVDSRTGISEGAGICTRDLADYVMVLSGLNRQNVEGTSEFLAEFRVATAGKKQFQIILSPIPNGEDELLERRRGVAEQKFQEAWGDKVELTLEIPYHPQLALTEEPHIFRRSRGYLFEAYRRIEVKMLEGLGHDAQAFRRRITESLKRENYAEALRDLHHVIRLDRGPRMLSALVDELLSGRRPPRSAEVETGQEPVSLDRLLADETGRAVVEFIVENLPLGEGDSLTRRLLHDLNQNSTELAEKLAKRILEVPTEDAGLLGRYAVFFKLEGSFDHAEVLYKRAVEADPRDPAALGAYAVLLRKRERFEEAEALFKRALEADPKRPSTLGNYALFLKQRERLEEAEAFFKRALEADPKHPYTLGNYALFLEQRQRFEEAEAFFKRAVEADLRHANNLSNYALFLGERDRFEEAEAFFKRAFEADPKHAKNLGNYATFLGQRDRFEEAEVFFKRALEADPKDPAALGSYASLLAERERFEEAEVFFKRALDADPKASGTFCNYGQFLAGVGRLQEAEGRLRQFFQQVDLADRRDLGEACLSLWLILRMQGRDATELERRFKFVIEQGFKRYRWSFEQILKQAEKLMSPDEFQYARALADAFLDESKVAELAKYPRWQALEPIDPKASPAGVAG